MSIEKLHRLGQGMTLKGVTTGVQIVVGLAISILLNHVYGKDDYGLLVLVYAVTALGFAVSDFGTKVTLVRFVPVMMQEKRERDVGALCGVAVLVQVTGILLIASCLLLASRWIAETFYEQPTLTRLVRFGIVYFAGFALFDFLVKTFQALQDWRREASLNIIFGALQAVSAVTIALVLRVEIAWVLLGNALAAFVTVALGIGWLPATVWQAFWRPTVPELKQGVRTVATFGLPLSVQSVYQYGVSWFDKLILGRFVPASELAMYYIASLFLNGLISLFKVLPVIFAPYVAELSNAGSVVLRRKFVLVFRWFLQVVVISSLIVFVAIEPAVNLMYGTSYEAVVTYTRLLLLVFVLRACKEPLGLFLINAFSMVRTAFVTSTVLAVTTFVATLALVPIYSTTGAIVATILGQLVSWVTLLFMAPPLRAMVPIATLRTTILALALAVGTYSLVSSAPVLAPVVGPLLVLSYAVALLVLREIGSEDLRIASELIKANWNLMGRSRERPV